jgi:hypothetical protein
MNARAQTRSSGAFAAGTTPGTRIVAMPRRFRPRLESVEPRLAPALGVLPNVPEGLVLLPSADGPGLYRVVRASDLSDVGLIRPFDDGFAGEVRAVPADVNADGYGDLIVALGPGGGPRVRVFDGRSLALRAEFLAFEDDFRGGVYVAATDVNRDGCADVVVGAGEGGGSRVRVFDSVTGAPLADFFAFEEGFRGGVRVAGGDVDADGVGEVVVGAGPGAGPRVVVFEVAAGVTPVQSFWAYEQSFTGGVYVAATNFPFFFSSGFAPGIAADIVTGPGDGGGPVVRVFPGSGGGGPESYLVGDPTSRTGLRVGVSQWGIQTETPTPAGPALALLVRNNPLVSFFPIVPRVVWTLEPGQVRLRGARVVSVDPAGALTVRDFNGREQVLAVRGDAEVLRFDQPADYRRFLPGTELDELLLAPDGSVVRILTFGVIPV